MNSTHSLRGSGSAGNPRTDDTVRAAGAATVMAGLMTMVYVVLFVVLAPRQADKVEFYGALVVGIALVVAGLGTLRSHSKALWVTVVTMAVILGIQLWVAYGTARKSPGAGLSIYLLTVPLVVLLVNTAAIGSVRAMRNRQDASQQRPRRDGRPRTSATKN